MHAHTTRAYIACGSNIAPKRHIGAAYTRLSQAATSIRVSPVYRSRAYGFVGADFFNAVFAVDTADTLSVLHTVCKTIEAESGRVRGGAKYCDRTLDLDVLLFGETVDTTYTVPHPDISRYAFVLRPLHDLAPTAVHPLQKCTVDALYRKATHDNRSPYEQLQHIDWSPTAVACID